MKYLFLFLIISFIFISCNGGDNDIATTPEETVSLIGNWNLVAIRLNSDTDPQPDDELEFVEFESNNIVSFYSDSTITSNAYSLCSNTQLEGNPTMGIYTLVDSTYTSEDCTNPIYKYHFKQNDSILIISYPNFVISEGKFKKIADLEE